MSFWRKEGGGGVGGGQKKSKYALNVWRMCSLDILVMNPISLPDPDPKRCDFRSQAFDP